MSPRSILTSSSPQPDDPAHLLLNIALQGASARVVYLCARTIARPSVLQFKLSAQRRRGAAASAMASWV